VKVLVEIANGAALWWWDFPADVPALHRALTPSLLERFRLTEPQPLLGAGEGHLEPLVDETQNALLALADEADARLTIAATTVRFDARDTALLLPWWELTLPARTVVKHLLPLARQVVTERWSQAPRDPFDALDALQRWADGKGDDATLANATRQARRADELASDGYHSLEDMSASWADVASASCVHELCLLAAGSGGHGALVAKWAAEAYVSNDPAGERARRLAQRTSLPRI